MFFRFARLLGAVAFLCAGLLATAQAQSQNQGQTIRFGILSTESPANLKVIWQPLLNDMARATGFDVQPVYANDYASLVSGLRAYEVDVAWLGNMAAVEAVDRSEAEVFVQASLLNGTPGYQSLLIVRKDSPINTVGDLLRNASQLTFGNGDPNSTSGYLVPGYYVFARHQIDPATAFKRMVNLSHEANALAVANGELDAATFNTENWDRLATTHPERLAQLKIIWKSQLIPADPLLWHKSLLPQTKSRLRAFFIGYGATAQQQAVLKGLQQNRFIASSNDQLLPIRQLLLFKQRTQVAASGLSFEEKNERLRDIDTALSTLQDRIKALEKKGPPPL